MLDEEGFKKSLEKRLNEKAIQQSIQIVKEAESFLKNKSVTKDFGQANIEDLRSIVDFFIKTRKNTWENLLALLRFFRFSGNRAIEVALLELLDGSDVLEKLSNRVKKTVGDKRSKELFEDIKLPPLGTFSTDKPRITKKFMEKLETALGEKACKEVLLSGPHAGSKKEYLAERKAFLESEGIDDFLRRRHNEYISELEQHMKEGTLYFTQEIDKEVLDYVRNTPTCQNGVREDKIIYVTKIPYMAKQYLNEKNKKMKRYYYCHCPWVREAIKSRIDI